MRTRCGQSRSTRLRRRLPFVAIAVALTAIFYLILGNRAVLAAGALAVLLLVLTAVWLRRSVAGPGGPPGGGPAGVREPRRPRPNPPAGSMAMALPVPLPGDPPGRDDATEVAWA